MTASHPIRPPALRAGDTVRLVSPAGPPSRERVGAATAMLRDWGLRVEIAPHAFDSRGYLAGDDDARLADINEAFGDPDVRGVLCTRGGYGSSRIVDGLDIDAILADPKPLVGYSDITAIFQALYRRGGLATLHGPVMTTFNVPQQPRVAESLRTALMSTADITIGSDADEATAVLTRGSDAVSGPLLGGNVSLLADALGTASRPDYRGAILFCEEVNEEPYRLDRMLTQLRRAGVLDEIAGVALGQFTDCVDEDWDVDVVDLLAGTFGELGVPLVGGLPIGHGANPLTVPVGTTATLDPKAGTLTAGAAVS